MENLFKENEKNDEMSYKTNTPKHAKSPKIKRKLSSPKKYRNLRSSFIPKKVMKENKNENQKVIPKIESAPKIGKPAPSKENLKDSLKNKKKEGGKKTNKKFVRKNAKKNIAPKKKRGTRIIIKGTVSEKLKAFIERLEQNTAQEDEEKTNIYGDKVVIAPRIKAAIEKFKTKKEEK